MEHGHKKLQSADIALPCPPAAHQPQFFLRTIKLPKRPRHITMAASMPQNVPDLGIPFSPHTVDVSIIDTTATIRGFPARVFLSPPIKGYDSIALPVFSFLVQHP